MTRIALTLHDPKSGNIAEVVQKAKDITSQLIELVNDGNDIVSAIPSCTFMLKQQWPLLLPENEVGLSSSHCFSPLMTHQCSDGEAGCCKNL